MARHDDVPDAWDDEDFEAKADRDAKEDRGPETETVSPPMTRAERMAKHAETQRQLWESAETEEEPSFLPVNSNVPPLATPFKPAVKLLSRKPAQADDDEDDEAQKNQPTPEEIRLRQQRELEEKQRRYEEARARIFGDSNPSSGQSTPGNTTPPQAHEGRQGFRGRGRGRGGGGAYRNDRGQDSQARRPQTNQQPSRELFDPVSSPRPGFGAQNRSGDESPQQSGRSGTLRADDQIIRSPRGPDGSGRGGFGFARRGAKDN
ncbi:hypothetical protein B0T26DRAFT_737073 [Lasiosphaeria miniovina]|uniref:SUZ RNA-binding domain-containing n=1 Tax=Lasiosphaeria miniovina TaxID=1954250 RepID=A0AA40BHL2_9PEZI|nr:uncharacterized protein B0T26DRAFT_737073 [Lasiosphaeria miniovina]KAK0734382.1 hypothetical protein B0T26DRAFT_737073 [Lasiosphaeria miniovina]